MKLHIDIETYSEADLKEVGLYRYAEHPSTELLVVCYAFDDGPVHVWVPMETFDVPSGVALGISARPEFDNFANIHVGMKVPEDLRFAVAGLDHEGQSRIAAHNAQFERVVLNGVAGQRHDFPLISIEQTICTMAKCRVMGLPGALEDAARALGTHPKMATGKNDMRAFAKPRNKESEPRWTPGNDPERFVRLVAYCIDDVKAERDLDNNLPDLTEAEVGVYRMDQRMNDRGVAVDLTSVGHTRALIAEYKADLESMCVEITGLKPSQRAKIADWVRANGWPSLTDMQADTVARLTMNREVPENVRQVLKIYSTYAMTAISKYETIEAMVCADGRLRGMFQFYGAGPGRWTSTGVQLQNLMRPVIEDANNVIELLPARSLALLKGCVEVDPMKALASCVRGMLVPTPGKQLLGVDYAGIESRLVAWLAGEVWKLDAFAKYDRGEGPNNYKLAYSRVFQVPVDSIKKGTIEYLIGKVIDLSMGFEGGASALLKAFLKADPPIDLRLLTEMAMDSLHPEALKSARWMRDEGYLARVECSIETAVALDAMKAAWRMSHPATADKQTGVWRQLKDAAIAAVRHPGQAYTIDTGLVAFQMQKRWLRLRLPSGRCISYFEPDAFGEPDTREEQLRYSGVDTDKRIWTRTATYGGKLMQNIAEGIGRDLLVHGMRNVERTGGESIMCVHDEAVAEIEAVRNSPHDLKEWTAVFLNPPAWAKGLPLAAEGFIGERYQK